MISPKKISSNDKERLYRCPECGLHYRDEKIAKKCAAWCCKYKSCNLEITKLSEEVKKRS